MLQFSLKKALNLDLKKLGLTYWSRIKKLLEIFFKKYLKNGLENYWNYLTAPGLIFLLNLVLKRYVKSVQIWSFFWSVFSHIRTERTDTSYLSVFSPNVGKYGPEKLRIWTNFTQWKVLGLPYWISIGFTMYLDWTLKTLGLLGLDSDCFCYALGLNWLNQFTK